MTQSQKPKTCNRSNAVTNSTDFKNGLRQNQKKKKKKLKTLKYLKIQIYNQKKTEKSNKCLVQLKSIFLRIITHCCISLEKKKKTL